MRDVVPLIGPGVGRRAADAACQVGQTCLKLPVVGTVWIPPPERLAWYGGIALLAGMGMLEWPVAVVLTAGHLLADQERFESLRAFGAALEHA